MKEIFLAKEGEIALKGLNKKTFENVLMKNIRYALSGFSGVNVSRAQSVIYIKLSDGSDYNAAYERLTKVFGIKALCRAALCEKDFDVIKTAATSYIRDRAESVRTFKVEAKRSDKKFPLDSPAISRELGGYILEQIPHLSVDVHNPDLTVNIEIREEHCYIHTGNIPAAGGLPVGTSGYALGLLSGGIDSPVALYMIAKRGVKTAAIHFEAPPYTSERAKLKVIALAKKIAAYTGGVRFYCVPFTAIQERLRDGLTEAGEDGYFTIIMRRLMLSIAEKIAQKEGFDALITGESIGQVASQTMGALSCTNICEIPVFRPLIGMDKSDIVTIAEKIDTFETSSLPYEDCCTVFTPKHPRTHPKRETAEKLQDSINFSELIEVALTDTEILNIRPD
ncbi:MAG: tRNA 4-thiouridine(8) synthase ThiI [Ruminococcus sp.]|nr:tRNA 4-thiouridine(8) synthase ThiI [Ruminococcus sp.]